MRITETIDVSAEPEFVWRYLENPDNYLHFLSGVTRWEVQGDQREGIGMRIRMLIRVGAIETGGLIEMVEWDEPRDLAWTSVSGIDQRGRIRLREAGDDRTRVELRFAYGVAGAGITGMLSEMFAKPTLTGHLRRSLQQLKRQVEHERLRTEASTHA